MFASCCHNFKPLGGTRKGEKCKNKSREKEYQTNPSVVFLPKEFSAATAVDIGEEEVEEEERPLLIFASEGTHPGNKRRPACRLDKSSKKKREYKGMAGKFL